MASQWKPLPGLKPGQRILTPAERNQELSAQERLIEQKKKEIETKLMEKRRHEPRSGSGTHMDANSSKLEISLHSSNVTHC